MVTKTQIIIGLLLFYILIYYPLHETSFIENAFLIGGAFILVIGLNLVDNKSYQERTKGLYRTALWILAYDALAVYLAINKFGFSRDINILMTLFGEFTRLKFMIGYLISAGMLYLLFLVTYHFLEEDYKYLWYVIFIFWLISITKIFVRVI